MSKAIHFSRIEIRKMPGFPRGGLAVEELADGINVVYGPNASGKTTLARAMQQLLRLNTKGRQTNSLTAQLSLSDKSYILDYHLGSTNCHSEGHEISLPPALAEARMGPWYVLALHDLVQQEDDQDIVRQVLREAAGGYDVAAAASELGFERERPRSTNIKEVRAYQEAQKSRKDAEGRLRDIDREEQGLGDLEQKRETAQQAVYQLKRIEHALEAHAANEQLEQKQRVVDAFPATMSKMVGNEREQLETLKTDLKKQQKKLANKNIVLETSQDAIQKTGLPESGVARAVVETLQVRVDLLMSQSREIQRLEGEQAAAQKKLSESLERLGPDVSPGQAETLDAALLNRLFEFVRKAETHRQNQQAVERVSHWLTEIPELNEDPETLREGIQLLQQWLAEQRIPPVATTPKWGWLMAAGLTILVGLGMILVHWSWLLLIAVAAGLALRAFLLPRSPVNSTGIQTIAEQWPGLGLASPALWTFSEVQSTLRLLQKNLAVAQVHQEKKQRFAELRESSEKLKQQQQQIEQVWKEWREKLGLELPLDDDALVYLLAEDIRKSQSAQAEMAAVCEKLAVTQQQQKELLTACREDLTPYALWPETAGAAEVAGLVRDLQGRGQDHGQARERLQHARDEIEQCHKTIAECQSERTELFKRLNLQEDDEATLQRWLEQFPQYRQATEKLSTYPFDHKVRH